MGFTVSFKCQRFSTLSPHLHLLPLLRWFIIIIPPEEATEAVVVWSKIKCLWIWWDWDREREREELWNFRSSVHWIINLYAEGWCGALPSAPCSVPSLFIVIGVWYLQIEILLVYRTTRRTHFIGISVHFRGRASFRGDCPHLLLLLPLLSMARDTFRETEQDEGVALALSWGILQTETRRTIV